MASIEGTKKFASKFGEIPAESFRDVSGLSLSSIGIGTYLGNADADTDERYHDSVVAFAEAGGNVIDTASNYRFQRSERSIGRALRTLSEKGFDRDEFFISTKGGYLPFDTVIPPSVEEYFDVTFVKPGIAKPEDLVSGSHCMTPKFLKSQIDQSLMNLGIEHIDLYYIHNPETDLQESDRYTFEAKLAKAFEMLEQERAAGRIGAYGVATWNGFRVAPDQQTYHSLERMVGIAKLVGGDSHGFRYIQLPHNLALPEAFLLRNQAVKGSVKSILDAASEFGVTVMCSASILQGQLTHSVPMNIREVLGNPLTDTMSSIEFVRSTPGVTTALVGMSRMNHVEENMQLMKKSPVSKDDFMGLFAGE
jgi:aryl-alcohol dehydrogenase-like predicted oxidoreductase